MSDQEQPPDWSGEPPGEPKPPGGPEGAPGEQVRYAPVGARIPDHVAEGSFCTGAIILESPSEFVVDFIQAMARPPRLAVRVVMSPQVLSQFVQALRASLDRYQQVFGPPKELPKPDPKNRPPIQEVYKELKIADRELSGRYANAVRIGHSGSDFLFDFITRFFPTAAVAARVYMSASQVPRVLETLSGSLQRYVQRRQAPPEQLPPPAPPQPPQEGPPESDW